MSGCPEKRAASLRLANEIRVELYALRLAVASGSVSVADVLVGEVPAEHARAARKVRVGQLLSWPRRSGPTTATRACARAWVNERARVERVPIRQRRELVRVLGEIRPCLAVQL
jgi:hypothetical protein